MYEDIRILYTDFTGKAWKTAVEIENRPKWGFRPTRNALIGLLKEIKTLRIYMDDDEPNLDDSFWFDFAKLQAVHIYIDREHKGSQALNELIPTVRIINMFPWTKIILHLSAAVEDYGSEFEDHPLSEIKPDSTRSVKDLTIISPPSNEGIESFYRHFTSLLPPVQSLRIIWATDPASSDRNALTDLTRWSDSSSDVCTRASNTFYRSISFTSIRIFEAWLLHGTNDCKWFCQYRDTRSYAIRRVRPAIAPMLHDFHLPLNPSRTGTFFDKSFRTPMSEPSGDA